jgi:hypothetical protein
MQKIKQTTTAYLRRALKSIPRMQQELLDLRSTIKGHLDCWEFRETVPLSNSI